MTTTRFAAPASVYSPGAALPDLLGNAREHDLRGRVVDAIAGYRAVIDAADPRTDAKLLAEALRRLGNLHRRRHELDVATDLTQRSFEIALGANDPSLVGEALNALAVIHFVRGDWERARQEAQRALAVAGDDDAAVRARVEQNLGTMANAEGDLDGALELLADAERHFFSDMSPDAQPIAAIRARVWLAQGRLGEARAWARERRLSPDDELTYVREYEQATLARLMLAQASRDRADDRLAAVVALTTRLVDVAEASGRNGAAIDVLVVQALAHHAQRAHSPALASLTRAIAIAEPEGHVRVFLDEGAPMAALLKETAKRAPTDGYVAVLQKASTSVARPSSTPQQLVEPLSERELEVLRLLATELSGPEIADHLVVSLNTVRTHTKNVFSKLGVNSRRAAVRRGEELDLLTRSGR